MEKLNGFEQESIVNKKGRVEVGSAHANNCTLDILPSMGIVLLFLELEELQSSNGIVVQ